MSNPAFLPIASICSVDVAVSLKVNLKSSKPSLLKTKSSPEQMLFTKIIPVDDVEFNTTSGAFECVTWASVIGRLSVVITEASRREEHSQKVQFAFRFPCGHTIEQSAKKVLGFYKDFELF